MGARAAALEAAARRQPGRCPRPWGPPPTLTPPPAGPPAGIGPALGARLTCLVARGNYGISRLPADLEALRRLAHLDLSRNMLWQLPAWLGRLQGLTHLNVSANW